MSAGPAWFNDPNRSDLPAIRKLTAKLNEDARKREQERKRAEKK